MTRHEFQLGRRCGTKAENGVGESSESAPNRGQKNSPPMRDGKTQPSPLPLEGANPNERTALVSVSLAWG